MSVVTLSVRAGNFGIEFQRRWTVLGIAQTSSSFASKLYIYFIGATGFLIFQLR